MFFRDRDLYLVNTTALHRISLLNSTFLNRTMDGEAFDKKLFSITSPEYRLSLASVTFLAGLVSILGNVLVLTAAIRGAIKLDKISVVLIKNISVADLAYALFVILQVKFLANLNKQKWLVRLISYFIITVSSIFCH